MKVREIMTSNVSTVNENSSVQDVANRMRGLNVGAMPVCNQTNNITGIVTDRDIVLRNVSEGNNGDEVVKNIMSSNIVSVSPETDVHEAARIMSKRQIRRLPVVENGRVVGMVSLGDFAVRDIYSDEAGTALSSISQPSKPLR